MGDSGSPDSSSNLLRATSFVAVFSCTFPLIRAREFYGSSEKKSCTRPEIMRSVPRGCRQGRSRRTSRTRRCSPQGLQDPLSAGSHAMPAPSRVPAVPATNAVTPATRPGAPGQQEPAEQCRKPGNEEGCPDTVPGHRTRCKVGNDGDDHDCRCNRDEYRGSQ